jgi:hypothetical protein
MNEKFNFVFIFCPLIYFEIKYLNSMICNSIPNQNVTFLNLTSIAVFQENNILYYGIPCCIPYVKFLKAAGIFGSCRIWGPHAILACSFTVPNILYRYTWTQNPWTNDLETIWDLRPHTPWMSITVLIKIGTHKQKRVWGTTRPKRDLAATQYFIFLVFWQ